jgi:hypothetical protein
MSARLFECLTLEPTSAAQPVITTPLGTLSLDAEVDGVVIGDLKPSAAYRLECGGYLLRWALDGITAELLLCRPQPAVSGSMTVDDCWAGMWRVRVSVPAESLKFSCLWEPGYLWTEGNPDSGEGLAAQTWEKSDQENGLLRVTVGTVDVGVLTRYAQRGLLPGRWANLLGWSYGGIVPDVRTGEVDPVVYLPEGFRFVFPALAAGEQCQVQFVVAWSSFLSAEAAKGDASTWYAVDCSPEAILLGAGCLE